MFQEPKITVNMISFHSLQEPINSLQVSRHQSPGAVQPQAEEIRPDQVAARLGCSILRQNKFRYDQSCIRVQESFFLPWVRAGFSLGWSISYPECQEWVIYRHWCWTAASLLQRWAGTKVHCRLCCQLTAEEIKARYAGFLLAPVESFFCCCCFCPL